MLPIEGTHQARLNGQMVFYTAQSGSECLAIPVRLEGGEVAWSGKSTATLVNSEGEAMQKTMQNLVKVFGPADKWIESGLARFSEDPEVPISEVAAAQDMLFEVVGEHKQVSPQDGGEPYNIFSIKWINPLGGGIAMPTAVSKKDFLAKHGAKFRALGFNLGPAPAGKAATTTAAAKPAAATATAKPAAKAAATPAKTSTPTKKPAGPPGKTQTAGGQAPTATMEEAWDTLQRLTPDMSEEDRGAVWYRALAEATGSESATNDDASIQQFGAMKVAFEAAYPAS